MMPVKTNATDIQDIPLTESVSSDLLFVSPLIWSSVHGCEVLTFLVVVGAQPHNSEGAAGNFLIENEHEGSGEHRLQQFGLQAFKQT